MHHECEISIITINYNGVKDTCELIDTLPLEDESLEVIVVDNASKEDEATIIEQRYPQVKVIRSKENLGFAGGNNLGIQVINRLESSPKIGAVCPKIRFAWGDNPIQFAGYTPLSRITMRNHAIGCGESDHGQYDTAHLTPYAHGAAMMVKREAIAKAGLMPECYFLYYEELDWSMMMRRAGYDVWYEPAMTVYHKESQTTGQQSPLRTYYITHNRLLFVKRNTPNASRYLSYLYLICLVACRDILKHTLQRRFDLVKAVSKGISDFINSQFSILNSQFSI